MQTEKYLTPESLTAVEILEGIDKVHRDQALEMLRNFAMDWLNPGYEKTKL